MKTKGRKRHKFKDSETCIRCHRTQTLIVNGSLTWCDGTDPIPEFNVRSNKQVSNLLIKLGVPLRRKTKSGYSVDEDALLPFQIDYPIVKTILAYRGVNKKLTTYARPILEMSAYNGKIYPSFNQTIVMDERLSSSNPNIQNIPKTKDGGGKIRECFVPRPGHVFISSDYSQLHLRILAHFSKDPEMVKAYTEGLDLHQLTADSLGVSRKIAKTINFGIIYSMSARALAMSLTLEGVPTTTLEAEVYIAKFFDHYKGVARWKRYIIEYAKTYGYAPSLFGFRVPLPDINLEGWTREISGKRGYEERKAVNSPILCTEAQIVKRAMISIYNGTHVVPLFQVHDDLTYEVLEKDSVWFKTLIKSHMETTTKLLVPLPVDQKVGTNWSEI